MSGEQEKKHFSYPKRDEVIDQIKELDDEIEHVSLNLIKCDFDATEKDVEKAFPQYKFIKVKNYNPGSFEVVFEMKIDAINFIRNCYDRKILARRFFIKMGRQHKEVVEDWACVGHVPRKFNNPHKKNYHKDGPKGKREGGYPKKEGEEKEKKEEKEKEKKEDKEEEKKQEKAEKTEKAEKVEKKGDKQEKKAEKEVETKTEAEKAKKEDDDDWIQIPAKQKGRKK